MGPNKFQCTRFVWRSFFFPLVFSYSFLEIAIFLSPPTRNDWRKNSKSQRKLSAVGYYIRNMYIYTIYMKKYTKISRIARKMSDSMYWRRYMHDLYFDIIWKRFKCVVFDWFSSSFFCCSFWLETKCM